MPGLHRLHNAIATFEKNAFACAVGVFDEGEAVALRTKARVVLDEIVLGNAKKCGERANIRVIYFDLSRPATAVGAALTLIVNAIVHAEQFAM